jgi:hypothetical protein
MQARHEACQRAIVTLAETLARVKPDRCIILGDDQHESFLDDIMPSVCVYNGETVDDVPDDRGASEPGTAALRNAPPARVRHTTDAAFGQHIIESVVEQGFEVARSNALPRGRHGSGGIGHAFYFVYRRLMNNQAIPHVPIFLNTYYPPNAATIKRCYALGKALGNAIESWDQNERVAVIASGGLTHFVIEEDLDLHVLEGLKEGDEAKITGLPNIRFMSGTSETRNWIALGGAMEGTGFQMNLLDYQPCYRSEAGTGCAGAYAYWQ